VPSKPISSNPDVLESAVNRAVERLSEPASGDTQRTLRDRLRQVDIELANLTAAVASGGDVQSLLAGIAIREQERQQIIARQQRVQIPAVQPAAILADLRSRLRDWRALLHDETPKARTLLKQVLVGRLEMPLIRRVGATPF